MLVGCDESQEQCAVQQDGRDSGRAIASLAGVAVLLIFVIQNTRTSDFQFRSLSYLALWLYTLMGPIGHCLVRAVLVRRHRRRKQRREDRRTMLARSRAGSGRSWLSRRDPWLAPVSAVLAGDDTPCRQGVGDDLRLSRGSPAASIGAPPDCLATGWQGTRLSASAHRIDAPTSVSGQQLLTRAGTGGPKPAGHSANRRGPVRSDP